jgi:flagellar biosynthesis GTPase FlhF
MTKHNTLIPVKNRIIFHLLDHNTPKYDYDVLNALTQKGIAQAVGTSQSHISDTIKKLVINDRICEQIGRVNLWKKKQRYYLLTEEEKGNARKLKKELSNLQITIKQPNDAERAIKLKDIVPYMEKEEICIGITELDIYNIISNDATLDIEHLKKFKRTQFIDFSADAPRLVHFFGRKREMTSLKKLVEEREVHNIIYINGLAGIGKTSLVAKLLEKYRGSKHIFWYNFQKLDTL